MGRLRSCTETAMNDYVKHVHEDKKREQTVKDSSNKDKDSGIQRNTEVKRRLQRRRWSRRTRTSGRSTRPTSSNVGATVRTRYSRATTRGSQCRRTGQANTFCRKAMRRALGRGRSCMWPVFPRGDVWRAQAKFFQENERGIDAVNRWTVLVEIVVSHLVADRVALRRTAYRSQLTVHDPQFTLLDLVALSDLSHK